MADASSADYLEVFQGQDGSWYFHAKANNGEVVAHSEAYTRESSAHTAAGALFPGVPFKGEDSQLELEREAPAEPRGAYGDE
jgi:uncharacterized protein YegP (UPF0339 family)